MPDERLNKNQLKAYEDVNFLKQDVCRPIRLQLELLKPEVTMQEQKIISTIVVMGSARQPAPDTAAEQVREAEAAAASEPDSKEHQAKLKTARQMQKQSRYYTMARTFSALASREGQAKGNGQYVVMTGGGGGIMEAGNRGAADVGGKSIGLNISLPFEQMANPYITPELNFIFHYFSIRKMHFLMRACALAAFPGGFGTLDEVFETLTLIQTEKIKRFPIVLFGREFWEQVVDWEKLVDWGMICPQDLKLFKICDSAEEGWECIHQYWKEHPEPGPEPASGQVI